MRKYFNLMLGIHLILWTFIFFSVLDIISGGISFVEFNSQHTFISYLLINYFYLILKDKGSEKQTQTTFTRQLMLAKRHAQATS